MRKTLFLILILLISVVPALAQDSNIFSNPWRAEYFNNPYLAGTPNLIRYDSGIGFDWGFAAPAENVPADNFSVRWGKGGTMPSGTYRFIVTSSGGFRLYLDNEVVLDRWDGSAHGNTVGLDLFIEAGYHNIQLDYYTLDADAYIFLDWGLAPDGEVEPQPTNFTGSNTVTITANTLNVRSEPRIANNIITRLTRGQQFVQIATTEDGRWVQLDLGNGSSGWVSAAFVSSDIARISTEDLRGQTLRSTTRLLIRSSPDSESEVIGLLLRGEDATIIGRSSDGNWWQIDDNGRIGWVNANYVLLSPDVDADAIEITE